VKCLICYGFDSPHLCNTSNKDPRIFRTNLRRGIAGERAMNFGGAPT